ncbi:ATP-dependent DNA ligase [Rathayibacter sp. VKM Ac-2805]|uniref:DUF7882 family protein n=1 Tax=Rathayibacter sp. VKM Ac-2805 TaxID=2609258 RepID=UPI00131F8164|nr:ATP-dependent DNA ligase [Rathayibacter sp. VKM Ac-2805]QHC72639.1 ATP-dependent DNA ligase [Rathayibacter sp. VKM Ac-2805]
MGRLSYDSSFDADFDDRTLAHLQIVIGSKLTKDESFYFSWRESVSAGSGRTSLWLHPAIALRFKYHGGRPPVISAEWVRLLLGNSYAPPGLLVLPEPDSSRPEGPSSA